MYESLYAHVPDLTVVSIGHRPSLRKFHQLQLHFTAAEKAVGPATAALTRIAERAGSHGEPPPQSGAAG